MPGILGLITNRPAPEAMAEVNTMLNCARHQDFYVSGTLSDETTGLYLGWTGRPDAFDNCMPLENSRKDLCLVFSGEDHPTEDAIALARRSGHSGSFDTASYLVHLFEKDEREALRLMNGWFCGILLDRRTRRVLLFNDRYGMGRLYFYQAPEGFYFASEAKALLKVRGELRKWDYRGLGELIACGGTLQDRTIFSNVSVMPGGSAWVFQEKRLARKDSYFSPSEWENQSPLDEESFHREFEGVFSQLVPRYFKGNRKIGMSITAGLDSRMVLSCANQYPEGLCCYTFSGMGYDTYDAHIGKAVSNACGLPHDTIRFAPDFLARFPQLAEQTVFISDGCHEVLGSHDLYFNQLARGIAPVRLSGKFGSEVVRGARHFDADSAYSGMFSPELGAQIRAAGDTMSGLPKNKVSFAAFAEIPWHEYGRISVERSQLTFDTPFMDNDLVRMMYRAAAVDRLDEIPIRLIKSRKPQLLDIMTDKGVRGRSPLSERMSELFYWTFLFKVEWRFVHMPAKYWAVGSVLEKLQVQRLFIGRHILTNYRSWFKGPLKDFLFDVLLSSKARQRECVNAREVEKMVTSHCSGGRSYVFEIGKALDLELTQRVFEL